MGRLGKPIQVIIAFIIGLILVLKLGGCTAANISSDSTPLPAVARLENPNLPDWIEQISPLDTAATQAQIRIRFKEPLVPVESLESKNQQDLLKKFELLPPLPGQFRFLTPRMVGFQADRAIPKATRVQVTLKAGLKDLKNHRLDKDLAWTFNTEPIKLENLPTSFPDGLPNSENVEPIDLQPVLRVNSNVELDTASVREQAHLIAADGKSQIPLRATLDQPPQTDNLSPEEAFDPTTRSWIYKLEPTQRLDKATRYKLEIAPGLRPAKGNLASESSFVSQVETYGPLTFLKLGAYGEPDAGGAYGRFVKGAPQLQFNNGLDAESAKAHVKISPAPKPDMPTLQVYDDEKNINLNPWALEPATTYTLTVESGLKDKFGQTLEQPVTLTYNTGDVAPDIWAPSDLNIFPTQTRDSLQLNISTVNLSSYQAAYQPVQPTDLVYFDSAYPREKGVGLLPDASTWASAKITPQQNQPVEVVVPIQKLLGGKTGLLAYGVRARTNSYQEGNQQKWREPDFYGLVQLTNLGVFAQWFPESGLVRVNHLSDGSAVDNAVVQIYQSKLEAKERPMPTPCATGRTDRTGLLTLNRQALQTCIGAGASFANPPQLLVVAQEGQDWAFTRTLEYSGAYDYGIDAGWQNGKPESRGTVFSDRQLYQPGETVWLTGAAYYLQGGSLKQDAKATYSLTLEGPDGRKTNLGNQTTNEFGTFSLKLPLEQAQPLGYYTVRAKGANGNEVTGEFRVAEFKPPNFKVALSLTGTQPGKDGGLPVALPNQTITAQTQSNYLFGAPVEGGQVKYYVTRQQAEFAPKGWQGFSFGRRWFWPEEAPEVATDVLQTNQVLDNNGKGQQTVTVAGDLPYPMTYRIDAQVADVSNLSVADSQSFLALPSDRLIGLKSDFVADAGKPFAVQVVVTDPTGQARSNQRLRLELQEMKYSHIARLEEGSRTQENQVEFKTVATAEVRSQEQPQSVNLTAPAAGSYRIRAMLADRRDEGLATDLQIWVTGGTPTFWGDRYRNNRLELKLDKASYQPGDLATVLIQSPYPEAELYLAVSRYDTLYQRVTKVKGSAPQVQFRVTPEMLPNAAVEAVLVRQGQPLSQVEPGSLDKLVRIGFVPFQVNLDNRYLKLELNPLLGKEGTPFAEPGGEQTVQLTLKDAQDRPAQGQVTLMVVNEAVLQLTGYRPPDLVKTVYAEQPISVRLSDNRPDVVLQPMASPLQKGWGYGGGLSAGAGNTRVRTNFQPIAHYETVVTDASGQAQVKFKLPDDLTTWRVMAVASRNGPAKDQPDWQFGLADASFITSQPLVTNPVLPQFARPGDRFRVGVGVTNNTGSGGNLQLQGAVTPPLQLDNAKGDLQTQMGTGTSAYSFPVRADQVGKAQVKFSSQLNQATDAFEVPLEVKPFEVMEQVVETGTTTSQATLPINVDRSVALDVGGLDINLASTLMPQLAAPAQQVLQQTDLPFLEPAASQLAIAANLQTLSQTYGQTFASFQPVTQANQAIARLRPLQRPDGGFAAYPGQNRSDPFVTPYAAQAIAQAERALGSQVNTLSTLQTPLKTYLSKLLADPGQYDFCKQPQCKNQLRLETLIALAELGDRRTDFLADIYAQRASLDAVQQIKLARYLAQFPEWQSEARAMAAEVEEVVYQTGRSATVNLPQSWRWLNSPTAIQSQALRLFIAQKGDGEPVSRLVQGLLSLRRDGTWPTTYDNAEALTALVDYSRLQPTPPSFQATAQLAGKSLGSATFEGYRNPSQDIRVPMAELPRNRQDLVLKKSGNGLLHYLVAYRYRLQGDQPGRLNGLRVTRSLRPANQDKVLFKTGLVAPEPLKVPAGQVYDVGLEIITDHAVDHVVITDPLPAGFEAVDNSFQTSTPYFQAQGDSWQLGYETIHRDRVVAYGDRLEPGVYSLHYLVRSVTPGNFLYPGAEAHLQYAPEEFGRSASSTLVVSEK
jgi:uncharacterized protein YfaS (alpha-2-macroglobulin family)